MSEFLRGYRGAEERGVKRSLADLTQASGALGLLEQFQKQEAAKRNAARAAAYETELSALGDGATQEQLVQLASKYAGPEKTLDIHQKSLDRQATTNATAATNAERISRQREFDAMRAEQAARSAEMIHEFRMGRVRTEAERAEELARHNKVMEGIQGQLVDLRAQATPAPLVVHDPGSPTGWSYQDRRDPAKRQVGAPPPAGARGGQGARLPASALRLQQEELDAIGIAAATEKDLGSVLQQLQTGDLKLGPAANVESRVRNVSGYSTKISRNYSSFRATLEKLRNDSLRLNKGVQTEGDAQRAWNELMENLNDQDVVKQRLEEIQRINSRARDFRRMNVDAIRSNYGLDPMDISGYENAPSAIGGPGAPPPAPPPAAPAGRSPSPIIVDW